MDDGQRRITSEEWRMENGEWRTANDEIENGKLTFF